MTMAEYEKAYAAARQADIDARIEALKAEVSELQDERKRYTVKRSRTTTDDNKS